MNTEQTVNESTYCQCVGACNKLSYDASLSYNKLDVTSPTQIDLRALDKIETDYIHALETRHRVFGSDLSDLLMEMFNIGTQIQNLDAVYSLNVLNPSVSVFSRVQQGSAEATQMLEQDLQVSFQGIDRYAHVYGTLFSYSLKKTLNHLEDIYLVGRDLVTKLGQIKN